MGSKYSLKVIKKCRLELGLIISIIRGHFFYASILDLKGNYYIYTRYFYK